MAGESCRQGSVQALLGHSSITLTIDVSGHLFPAHRWSGRVGEVYPQSAGV